MPWIELLGAGNLQFSRTFAGLFPGRRNGARPGALSRCLALLAVSFSLTLEAGGQAAQTPPGSPSGQPAAQTSQLDGHAAPKFVVFLDPAHGGSDLGAQISDQVAEKNLVLSFSARLRSLLGAHGITVVSTRESDTQVPVIRRAEMANHIMPALCVTLHATASGVGVHLFTSSLTQSSAAPQALHFVPWETAQAAYAPESQRLSSEIDSAMTKVEIPVTLGRTALEPLDNFLCPAVAIELAPSTSGNTASLSDALYQGRFVSALAAAIEEWQREWKPQP